MGGSPRERRELGRGMRACSARRGKPRSHKRSHENCERATWRQLQPVALKRVRPSAGSVSAGAAAGGPSRKVVAMREASTFQFNVGVE